MNNRLPINDERLSAYLDDELSREERTQIESLLEQREDYRTALEELRSVRAALKSLTGSAGQVDSQAPDGFAERVRAEVRATASSAATLTSGEPGNGPKVDVTPASTKGGFQSYIGPLAALAALVLALLTVPSILNSNRNVARNPGFKSEAAASVDRNENEPQDFGMNEIGQQDKMDSPGLEGMDVEADVQADAFQSTDSKKSSFGEDTRSTSDDDDRDSTLRRLQSQSIRTESETEPGPGLSARKTTAAPMMDAAPAIAADEEAFDDSTESGAAKGEIRSFNLSSEPAVVVEATDGTRADAETDELGPEDFSLGCDAVGEVKLKTQEQTVQFVQTLLNNNVQVDESSWLAASVANKKEQSLGRGGAGAAGEDGDEEESLLKRETRKSDAQDRQSGDGDALAWAANDDEGMQAIILDVAAADVEEIVNQLRKQSIEFNILTVAEQKVNSASVEWSSNPQPSYGLAEGRIIDGADTNADEKAKAVERGVSAASSAYGGGAVSEDDVSKGVANRVQLSSVQATKLNRLKEIHKLSRGVEANRFGQSFYYGDYSDLALESGKDVAGESDKQEGVSATSNAGKGMELQSRSRMDVANEPAGALRYQQSQTAAVKQLIDITNRQQPKPVVPQCRILITVNPPESAAKK